MSNPFYFFLLYCIAYLNGKHWLTIFSDCFVDMIERYIDTEAI